MFNLTLFSFADLTQVRSLESLNRRIDRLLHEERDSIPIHYYLIRPGIKRFCFTGFNPDVLESLQKRVSEYVPTTKFEMDEKANCLMAVELAKSMIRPVFPDVHFEKGETIDLVLAGTHIHVVTDATLSWTDEKGVKHVGAIKTKIRKSVYTRETAQMVACLVAKSLLEQHADAVVDPTLCLCYDVFRQRLVPAGNLSRNLEVALEVAEMIAARGDLAA